MSGFHKVSPLRQMKLSPKSSETVHIFLIDGHAQLLSRVQLFTTPYSPSSSFVQGTFQARIQEWVATAFSRGSSWLMDWTHISALAAGSFTIVPPGKPIWNGTNLVSNVILRKNPLLIVVNVDNHSCHFSEQRMLQPQSHQGQQQLHPTFTKVHPERNSRWRKTGYCPYIIKGDVKGIISTSPDSFIFPLFLRN